MKHLRISRVVLTGLACVAVACSGDTAVTPTTPDFADFAAVGSEGKPSYGRFDVTVTGDVNSDGMTVESVGTKLDGTQVVTHMALDLRFFETALSGGSECFGGISGQGSLDIHLVKKNDPTKALAQHFFHGFGNDGETEIVYQLRMFGTIAGNWLPSGEVGETSTVTLDSWEMNFDSKGGQGLACTGSSDGQPFNSTITVERSF